MLALANPWKQYTFALQDGRERPCRGIVFRWLDVSRSRYRGYSSTFDRETFPGDHTAHGEKIESREKVRSVLEEEMREREKSTERDQVLLPGM